MYEWLLPIYDIGFFCVAPFYLIKYALRGRIKRDLLRRFFLPEEERRAFESVSRPIWIHAVSVGEVNSLKEFLRRLRDKFPDVPVVISTITPQGKELADKLYRDKAYIFYLPVDVSFIIKKIIKLIGPRIFLCLETEIWPNLYLYLHKRGVPIIIFNARISNKSFKFYRPARTLLKSVLRKVCFIAAQDSCAEKRFLCLGIKRPFIKVTGNMKFKSISVSQHKVQEYRKKWFSLLKSGKLLIVAGSTHGPEEEILIGVYKKIIADYPQVRLLLCPRHVERVLSVVKMVERAGFRPGRVSRYREDDSESEDCIFILDATGELIYFYSLADIVFVGGSLSKHGGHNILEPAYFYKPVIFGEHMFNFEDIRRSFLDNRASIQVKDASQLKESLLSLIKDEEKRTTLGKRARFLLDESKDSVEENLKIVEKYILKDARC